MLRRSEDAIVLRVASLLGQAERFAEGGFADEAEDLLAQAWALDSMAAGVVRVRELIAEARARAAAELNRSVVTARPTHSASAKQAPRRYSRKEIEEIDDLYRRGYAAAQAGRTMDAIR